MAFASRLFDQSFKIPICKSNGAHDDSISTFRHIWVDEISSEQIHQLRICNPRTLKELRLDKGKSFLISFVDVQHIFGREVVNSPVLVVRLYADMLLINVQISRNAVSDIEVLFDPKRFLGQDDVFFFSQEQPFGVIRA